jgi:alkaline phosphatase
MSRIRKIAPVISNGKGYIRPIFISSMKNAVLLAVVLLSLSFATVSAEDGMPENVIFMIGDGMGVSHVTLTRVATGDLNMDKFPYGGIVTTYPLSSSGLITDSAAAGTALATGHKTDNGVISQIPTGEKLKTAFEAAVESGKSAGIVTTSKITDATPACFYAHTAGRSNEDEIAEQLLISGADVILGGGLGYFLPSGTEGSKRKDNLNLTSEFEKEGYQFVRDRKELLKAEEAPVIGLFTPSYMSFELDRGENEPSIAEMTQKAIELLSQSKNGFFLMVEGGRIDHEAHANDAAGVIAEIKAFDKAIGLALDFASSNRKTLVVVTADHSTGGMVLGSGTKQWYKPELLRSDISFESFAPLLTGEQQNMRDLFERHYGITDLTDEEMNNIAETVKGCDLYTIESAIAKVVSARTNIVFTTTQHDGGAVPLFSYGPGAFGGFMDNTGVGSSIKEMAAHKEEGMLGRIIERIRH